MPSAIFIVVALLAAVALWALVYQRTGVAGSYFNERYRRHLRRRGYQVDNWGRPL